MFISLEILKKVDLTATSKKKIRTDLEKSLGVDLLDKKDLIGKLVADYVAKMDKNDDEEVSCDFLFSLKTKLFCHKWKTV